MLLQSLMPSNCSEPLQKDFYYQISGSGFLFFSPFVFPCLIFFPELTRTYLFVPDRKKVPAFIRTIEKPDIIY